VVAISDSSSVPPPYNALWMLNATASTGFIK
jgi:hypothetical protein